jgi:hypothetical protein
MYVHPSGNSNPPNSVPNEFFFFFFVVVVVVFVFFFVFFFFFAFFFVFFFVFFFDIVTQRFSSFQCPSSINRSWSKYGWSLPSKQVVTSHHPTQSHRNLRTRRRMHLYKQENQIGRKFTGLAPADMAGLPHLINTKNSF